MNIGVRIRAARTAAGMSIRQLAQAAGVSHTAISKYERGRDVPSSDVLLRLGNALSVDVEFFLRPGEVRQVVAAGYRTAKKGLSRTQERAILGKVQSAWLEPYLEIEELLMLDGQPFPLPEGFPYPVGAPDDVEDAALALRRGWQLGLDAIGNFTELLEEKGIKVGLVDAPEDFDALAFRAAVDGREALFVVMRRGMPGDRERFCLAHELGHLLLDVRGSFKIEKALHRFAAAFLVPEPTARLELGANRRTLDLYELHLLKHKYGLSMQAWIHRAEELSILPQSAAKELRERFKAEGWLKVEPGDQYHTDTPTRLERLVMRALAEGVVSEGRAAELLGRPLRAFLQDVSKQHGGLPASLGYRR